MHKNFLASFLLIFAVYVLTPIVVLAADDATAGLGPSTSGIGPATSGVAVSDGTTGAVLQPANPQSLQSAASDSLAAPTPADGGSSPLQVIANKSNVSEYLKGETDPSSRQTPESMPLSETIAWLEIAMIIVACAYIYTSHHFKHRHLRKYYYPQHSRVTDR